MKYILKGTVVTMGPNAKKIKNCYVCISENKIIKTTTKKSQIPSEFKKIKPVNVKGYIFPGLIDLHNHIAFNFLNLWKIEKTFQDRYQWPNGTRYQKEITIPTLVLSIANAVELVKYAEVKALLGGVTSIDGYSRFKKSYSAWLLRNVETEPFGKDEGPIYQSVPRLKKTEFLSLKKKMKNCNAFIYHLAEGTSSKLLVEFAELEKNKIQLEKLVAIHCTALTEKEWNELGKNKTKMVWSPLSNLLLYGDTAKIDLAKKSGVLICLGSDWSPTGSKSLLWELKVAHLYNKEVLGGLFSDKDLAEMVTLNPARALGWDDKLGSISDGKFADIAVFDELDSDPYHNLIRCTEENIRLCVIDGKPRYGDRGILENIGILDAEKMTVGSREKSIDIREPGVEYGDVKLNSVIKSLEKTLADPVQVAKDTVVKLQSRGAGAELMQLIIDEDFADDSLRMAGGSIIEKLKKVNEKTISTLPLDSLTMLDDKDFFKILKANPNIKPYMYKLEQYLSGDV